MATRSRSSAPAVFPLSAYHAATAAGILAAHAWFAHPTATAANYRHAERVEYVGWVIDQSSQGCVPLAAADQGFTDGFNLGLAQVIAGGAGHA